MLNACCCSCFCCYYVLRIRSVEVSQLPPSGQVWTDVVDVDVRDPWYRAARLSTLDSHSNWSSTNWCCCCCCYCCCTRVRIRIVKSLAAEWERRIAPARPMDARYAGIMMLAAMLTNRCATWDLHTTDQHPNLALPMCACVLCVYPTACAYV